MLNAIGKIILRSKIHHENLKRQKKFLPWDQVGKIALIIDKDDSLNKSIIDRFIDETKKYIEVYYIETGSKQRSYNDWQCFSKKDKSLLNLPNKNVERELKNKKFDVVINTCSENNLFALSVCSSLSALLNCSENNRFNLADLIIKKTGATNLVNYLNETVRYLKMIRG
jgi:hypothetical protein